MNRIEETFRRLRGEGRAALIPFIVAGDPNFETTEELVRQMARSGADLLELGIPYSDPLADGPTIQAASQRALKNGASLEETFALAGRLEGISAPLILMTYFNPVLRHGLQAFARDCRENAVAGVIIADLPPEEAGPWIEEARKKDLATIFLAAPTSSPERVKRVEMYYALKNPCSFTRAWRDANGAKKGDAWVGKMPVMNIDDYVFGYANITYDTTVVLSTDFDAAIPSRLGKAQATDKASDVIYSGGGGLGAWSNVAEVEGPQGIQGFRSTDNNAGSGTDQINDPKWKAPPQGQLGFKFYCTQPVTLILTVDNYYECELEIPASDQWQDMVVNADRLIFRFDKKPMKKGWEKAESLHIKPKPGSDITQVIFAQLRWVAAKTPGAK